MAAVLWALNQRCSFVCFFALFITYFVDNVAATVFYNRKKILENRTAITHLELDEEFIFNELDERDLLQTPEQTIIPVICRRKKWKRYHGRRSGCLVGIRRRSCLCH
jgi:hypothetical protein